MRKRIYSCEDHKGRLCVDCSECTRGGNGNEECIHGWSIKNPGLEYCIHGTLLPNVERAMEKGERYYDENES